MGLHQFLECAVPNDAVTATVVVAWKAFRAVDPKSRIWASAYDWQAFRGFVGHYENYDFVSRPEDICLYHVSCDSPIADYLAGRDEKLAVFYHNVTPGSFFARLDPQLAERLEIGRRQVQMLAARCSVAFSASRYSAQELIDWGFPNPVVVGAYAESSGYEIDPDPETLGALRASKGDGPAVLFVGRLTPNKAQHKLIEAVGRVKQHYGDARLWLVGGDHTPSYTAILEELADHWGLGRVFAGKVSQPQLIAYLKAADIFCSVSEHEGFGIPLIEAMRFDCPIVAYASTAVPETTEDAAMLLDTNDPAVVAEAIVALWEDASARSALVEAGRKRLARLPTEEEFGAAVLAAL
jgi:glycosyltransferase involved in cell wall biosynthesis